MKLSPLLSLKLELSVQPGTLGQTRSRRGRVGMDMDSQRLALL
jgi:hypothetical protein